MKRVAAAAGAFAVGLAGLHGANVTGLTPQEKSKWWILSGALGTFYDDNSFNQPDSLAEGSFGFEFKPGVSVNLPMARTLLRGSYNLTLDFYEARPDHKIDQNHRFNGQLNHKFSERYELDADETFMASDEPAVNDTGGAVTVFRRTTDASNIRNQIGVQFSALMTPIFGVGAGYKNSAQDYRAKDYSSYLDQVEHQFHFDGRWFGTGQTLFFTGYQFGFVDYTSRILLTFDGLEPIYPDIKNSRSHYLYVGGKREFNRQLEGMAQVGVQYTDYYNVGESSWSPYVDLTATYTYLPQSTLQLGANVKRYPTDTGAGEGAGGSNVTLDQLAGAVFVSVSHRLTSLITGNVQLSYQHSIFNGGILDGVADDYFSTNAGLDYKIRENLYASMSYTWSQLSSSRPGAQFIDFTRNRIFLGIRATY